jgi:glycosyltransferase involved in cell wall biosynthesis
MNIGIFTDNDFEKVNGITTTLTAVLRSAPPAIRLRVYTAATLSVVQRDYLALKSVGVPIPFYSEMRLHVPRLGAYLEHARADRLDLVHLTTPGPVGLAGLFVAWKLRLPLIGSFHTDLAAYATTVSGSPRVGRLVQQYLRWPYGRCARVLVPSAHARRLLAGTTPDSRRLVVAPHGVDSQLFTPAKRSQALRDRWHVSDRRPALLYVGRVSREKGLSLLPHLRDRLYTVGVEHRLIIAGEGPMVPQLREALPDAVFTGPLSREGVAEAFASADLFVFPSRTDTAGDVVLEAQASGLPVIVAGEGGPRENLISCRTGAICYSDDPDEWAGSVLSILRGGRLGAMRDAARQYALTRRWERALEPLFRAYADVGAAHEAARTQVVPLAAGSLHDANL